jgi:CubicO group peptidase (beta-lactamase class C family)
VTAAKNHRRPFALVAAFAALLLITGCRTAATWKLSDPQPAVARLAAGGSIRAEADALVQPLLARGELFGLVVGVVTPDGAMQSFSYGQSGRTGDTNAPSGEDLFQVGSLSKLFTETLFVQLEADGVLHDDDTVRELFPAHLPVSEAAGRLTLHQLATHTAGLPREPTTLAQFGSMWRYFATGQNIYAHLTVPYAQDYLRHAHPQPKSPPKFLYSNLGAGLLAYLISEKTGRPATELIEEKICRPLALSNSVFFLNPEQQTHLALGHVGDQACWKFADTPLPAWDYGDLLRPIGGMYASVNDLLRFARANLGLTPTPLAAALAATQRPQIQTARGAEALGWVIEYYGPERRALTFKYGMSAGYCAYIGMDLNAHVAVVALANKFSWDEKVGHNLLLRLALAHDRQRRANPLPTSPAPANIRP